MRIAVLAQSDIHAIPENIERLACIGSIEICSVGIVTGPADVKNRRMLFLKAFGLRQSGLVFFFGFVKYVRSFLVSVVNSFGNFCRPISIRNVCSLHGIEYLAYVKPNSNEYISYIEANEVDLIVSFSAPVVFGGRLLSAPRAGCLNLHCSLLPEFAGVMPSFWTLYMGATEVGASVHYMDSKIDNGKIVAQRALNEVPVSIYENIIKTKKLGGELMRDVVKSIVERGAIECIETRAASRSYFGWPTLDELRDFRKRGGRFV